MKVDKEEVPKIAVFSNDPDPFWQQSAEAYLDGLFGHLREDETVQHPSAPTERSQTES